MTRPDALVYAVRPRVVGRHLGQIGLALAALGLPPLGAALWVGSWGVAVAQVGVVGVLAAAGWALARRSAPAEVQTNEALVVTGGAFVLASLAAAVPFLVGGLGPVDAFFEAVSGVTTTGLTVLPDAENASPETLFNRGWSQWYGGLGFVTLATVLINKGSLVRRIARIEEEQDLEEGTRAHGRRVLGVYLALTVLGIVGLVLLGTGPFDALIHTFSAVSTGGFSGYGDSLAGFSVPSQALVLVLTVLGATSFLTLSEVGRGQWRDLLDDPQLRLLLLFGLAVSVLLFLTADPSGSASVADRAWNAVFTGLSAQTTSGFSTWSTAALADPAKVVLLAGMFVGGAAGSTAGGIKVIRLLAALEIFRGRVVDTALPSHAVRRTRVFGEVLEPEEGLRMLGLVFAFVLVIGGSWLCFVALGHPPLDSLVDVVSAMGTVGLSTGVVGPELEGGLKLLLCGVMLAGRLELMALVVLLAPRSWIGRRR